MANFLKDGLFTKLSIGKDGLKILADFLLNPTDEFIPLKQGDVLIDSALKETATEITSGKTFITPGGSLDIGSALTISDFGGTPQFINSPYDESFVPVMNENDKEELVIAIILIVCCVGIGITMGTMAANVGLYLK